MARWGWLSSCGAASSVSCSIDLSNAPLWASTMRTTNLVSRLLLRPFINIPIRPHRRHSTVEVSAQRLPAGAFAEPIADQSLRQLQASRTCSSLRLPELVLEPLSVAHHRFCLPASMPLATVLQEEEPIRLPLLVCPTWFRILAATIQVPRAVIWMFRLLILHSSLRVEMQAAAHSMSISRLVNVPQVPTSTTF